MFQRPGGGTITLDDDVLDRGGFAESPSLPRRCYAATHVVFRASYAEVPHSIDAPGSPEEIAEHIDWDATLAVRARAERASSARRSAKNAAAAGRAATSRGAGDRQ